MKILELLLLVIGALIAVAVIVISGGLNWVFGYSLAIDPQNKNVLGGLFAALDALKAVLPIVLVVGTFAWYTRWSMRGLYLALAVLSFLSAYQFVVGNRSDTQAVRADDKGKISTVDKARNDLRVEKARIETKKTRPLSEVKRHYETRCFDKRRKQRWGSCKRMAKELGRAERLAWIEARLIALGDKRGAIKVIGDVDPGISSIADETGLSKRRVFVFLGLLLAFVLELATGFAPAPIFTAIKKLLEGWNKDGKQSNLAGTPRSDLLLSRDDGLVALALDGAGVAHRKKDAEASKIGYFRDGLREAGQVSEVRAYFAACIHVIGELRAVPAETIYHDYLIWQENRAGGVVELTDFVRLFGEQLAQRVPDRDVVGSENVDGGSVTVFRYVSIKLRAVESTA